MVGRDWCLSTPCWVDNWSGVSVISSPFAARLAISDAAASICCDDSMSAPVVAPPQWLLVGMSLMVDEASVLSVVWQLIKEDISAGG